MDIESIQKKYKLLVLDITTSDSYIFTSDRQVSQLLKKTYDINLSHMYIRRHLKSEDYILKGNVLVKKLW
jgi:hypothetical protein